MKPTLMNQGTAPQVAPSMSSAPLVQMAPTFPVALTTEQSGVVQSRAAEFNFFAMPPRSIATIGAEAESALHRTLDGFLERVNYVEDPTLFKLYKTFSERVDEQKLPEIADRIINGGPSLKDKFIGFFSKKKLASALDEAWEETRRLAAGKTKTLVDLIKADEKALVTAQKKLIDEIDVMEAQKAAYRERFNDFVVAVACAHSFVQAASAQVDEFARTADPQDHAAQAALTEQRDKLQALESRALALEGTLSRLPADQLVIRQLQNAGIQTLQEVSTTASARYASVKMTLLNIHSALAAHGVQRLSEQGAVLDANLARVQAQLARKVISTAATAPGENRLAQAESIQKVVKEATELANLVESAQAANTQKFAEARRIFKEARDEMLALGQTVRPDRKVSY